MKRKYPSDSNRKPTRPYLKWFRRIFMTGVFLLTFLIICTFAGTGLLVGYMASIMKEEPTQTKATIQQQMNSWKQTSYAYDQDQSLIGAMRTDADRKWVKKEEVSPKLIDALIATEDHEFYQHQGISVRGILRAAYQNITKGTVASGGSTITQQLVKNVILENRKKALERKIKEVGIALRLERLFNKDEILTFYLNSLFFGKGSHQRNLLGVQAASQGIFAVDAKDLNLAQAAYLAGMIQRPAAFHPFKEQTFEAGQKRMKTVLSRMRKTGKITAKAEAEALHFDLKSSLAKKKKRNVYSRHPFLMSAVEERAAIALMKADGLDGKRLSQQGLYRTTLEQYRKRILTGGYRIHTTLDSRLYQAINQAAQDEHLYASPITYTVQSGNRKKTIHHALEEVGVTLIDVRTGGILAFVGGRDFGQAQINHALNSRRQPGSTIKPLLDYGPALDQHYITPGSILVDEPLTANGSDNKTYKNHNNRYQGPVTAREALKWSLNIPAIKLLRTIGIHQGFSYLKELDFPLDPKDGEASAIGGFTRGFTVEEITSGYAMLANKGVYHPPHLIDWIEDPQGNVVYKHPSQSKRILSVQASWLVTDMLQDVMKRGTGRWVKSQTPGTPLAGKTGTTQKGYDVWFIGYTPRMALGVWVGYDQNHPLPNNRRAKRVWSRVFRSAIQTRPDLAPKEVDFARPEGLEEQEICKITGQIATDACRSAKSTVMEVFPVNQIPDEICLLHGEERVVTFQGKEYLADPRTPKDLTEKKIGLRIPEEEKERYQHYKGTTLPMEWDPRTSMGTPTSPKVFAISEPNAVRLVWNHTGDYSVVGYRIYRDGKHVASIQLQERMSYSGPAGNYTIRAVDIAGVESEDGIPSILNTPKRSP